MDYQLGSYFKPSHLSLEKFRRKLSYKLKPIINFGALFMYHEWSLLSHVIVGRFLSKEAIDKCIQNTKPSKTNHKKVKKIITQKDYYVDGLLICLISPCFNFLKSSNQIKCNIFQSNRGTFHFYTSNKFEGSCNISL